MKTRKMVWVAVMLAMVLTVGLVGCEKKETVTVEVPEAPAAPEMPKVDVQVEAPKVEVPQVEVKVEVPAAPAAEQK